MVQLSVLPTPDVVERLKAGLRKTAPRVKSSHRAEALARGLGFATNAELRERLKSPCPSRPLDVAAFCDYLAEREFASTPAMLLRAGAYAVVLSEMDRDEQLHLWGWGCGQPQRREDGKWETSPQHYERFLRYREEMKSMSVADQVLRSIALLSKVPATKSVRPDTDSYRLKHIAENMTCAFPDGEELGPAYVANGALIAAASHLGFRYRTRQGPDGWDWPNVTFNMSKTALLELDIEIRPTGARAQDRRRREEARRFKARWGNATLL